MFCSAAVWLVSVVRRVIRDNRTDTSCVICGPYYCHALSVCRALLLCRALFFSFHSSCSLVLTISLSFLSARLNFYIRLCNWMVSSPLSSDVAELFLIAKWQTLYSRQSQSHVLHGMNQREQINKEEKNT